MNTIPLVRLFGTPCLQHTAGSVELPWQRPTALMARLICQPQWHARDTLAARLRPDADLNAARAWLRRLLHRLKGFPAPVCASIEIESDRLRWTGRSDVQRFEALFLERDWPGAVDAQPQPLLADCPPLGDDAFDEWLEDERHRLRRKWRQALKNAIESCDDPSTRLGWMQRLAEDDPLDEDGVRFLMLQADTTPQQRFVLDVYDELQRRMVLDLGVKPDPQTSGLAHRLRTLAGTGAPHAAKEPTAAAAPPAPVAAPPREPGVPARGRDLVGRDAEWARLIALLADPQARLISICGAGGCGKTRLMREVLSGFDTRAAGQAGGAVRCVWVDLVAVRDEAGLLTAIAEAVEQQISEGDVLDQVARALGATPTWLLLDNFEQLVSHRRLIDTLIERNDRLRCVVTTREPLTSPREHRMTLDGLDWKGPESSAAQLFCRLAKQQGNEVAPRDMPCVERIVARVQGLPLAIEWAAAWLAVMSPADIDRELRRDLSLFDGTGGATDVTPARGLRAVFRSSWDRLSVEERRAVLALGVIRSPASLTDVRAVSGVATGVILQLAVKSLVQRQAPGHVTVHPLVRQYASEAADPDVLQRLKNHHAQHYLAKLSAPPALDVGRINDERLNALSSQVEDYVAAWCHAVDLARFDVIALAVRNLEAFLFMTARYEQSADLGALAADALPVDSTLRARLDGMRAAALAHLGRWDEARQVAQAALERGPDAPVAAILRLVLARVLRHGGAYSIALPHAVAAEEAGREAGDVFLQMRALQDVGMCYWSLGELERARTAMDKLLVLANAHGADLLRARALRLLSILKDALGEYEGAVTQLRSCLAFFEKRQDAYEMAFTHRTLSYAYLNLGDLEAQRRHAQASVDLLEQLGLPHEYGESLCALGIGHLMTHELAQASSHFQLGLSMALRASQTPLALRCIGGLAAVITFVDRQRGLGLLSFCANHPSLRQPDRVYIDKRLKLLKVTPEEWQNASHAHKGSDLLAVCASLLADAPNAATP